MNGIAEKMLQTLCVYAYRIDFAQDLEDMIGKSHFLVIFGEIRFAKISTD